MVPNNIKLLNIIRSVFLQLTESAEYKALLECIDALKDNTILNHLALDGVPVNRMSESSSVSPNGFVGDFADLYGTKVFDLYSVYSVYLANALLGREATELKFDCVDGVESVVPDLCEETSFKISSGRLFQDWGGNWCVFSDVDLFPTQYEIYDVSVSNAVDGEPAKYSSLLEALEHVDSDYRLLHQTVAFISSETDKYEYAYMYLGDPTDDSDYYDLHNWRGCPVGWASDFLVISYQRPGQEPTGSMALVVSGANGIYQLDCDLFRLPTFDADNIVGVQVVRRFKFSNYRLKSTIGYDRLLYPNIAVSESSEDRELFDKLKDWFIRSCPITGLIENKNYVLGVTPPYDYLYNADGIYLLKVYGNDSFTLSIPPEFLEIYTLITPGPYQAPCNIEFKLLQGVQLSVNDYKIMGIGSHQTQFTKTVFTRPGSVEFIGIDEITSEGGQFEVHINFARATWNLSVAEIGGSGFTHYQSSGETGDEGVIVNVSVDAFNVPIDDPVQKRWFRCTVIINNDISDPYISELGEQQSIILFEYNVLRFTKEGSKYIKSVSNSLLTAPSEVGVFTGIYGLQSLNIKTHPNVQWALLGLSKLWEAFPYNEAYEGVPAEVTDYYKDSLNASFSFGRFGNFNSSTFALNQASLYIWGHTDSLQPPTSNISNNPQYDSSKPYLWVKFDEKWYLVSDQYNVVKENQFELFFISTDAWTATGDQLVSDISTITGSLDTLKFAKVFTSTPIKNDVNGRIISVDDGVNLIFYRDEVLNKFLIKLDTGSTRIKLVENITGTYSLSGKLVTTTLYPDLVPYSAGVDITLGSGFSNVEYSIKPVIIVGQTKNTVRYLITSSNKQFITNDPLRTSVCWGYDSTSVGQIVESTAASSGNSYFDFSAVPNLMHLDEVTLYVKSAGLYLADLDEVSGGFTILTTSSVLNDRCVWILEFSNADQTFGIRNKVTGRYINNLGLNSSFVILSESGTSSYYITACSMDGITIGYGVSSRSNSVKFDSSSCYGIGLDVNNKPRVTAANLCVSNGNSNSFISIERVRRGTNYKVDAFCKYGAKSSFFPNRAISESYEEISDYMVEYRDPRRISNFKLAKKIKYSPFAYLGSTRDYIQSSIPKLLSDITPNNCTTEVVGEQVTVTPTSLSSQAFSVTYLVNALSYSSSTGGSFKLEFIGSKNKFSGTRVVNASDVARSDLWSLKLLVNYQTDVDYTEYASIEVYDLDSQTLRFEVSAPFPDLPQIFTSFTLEFTWFGTSDDVVLMSVPTLYLPFNQDSIVVPELMLTTERLSRFSLTGPSPAVPYLTDETISDSEQKSDLSALNIEVAYGVIDVDKEVVSDDTEYGEIPEQQSICDLINMGAVDEYSEEKYPYRSTISVPIDTKIPEVIPVEQIELNKSSLTLEKNSTSSEVVKEQLTAEVLPVNASNRNLIWSSSNRNIADVDQSGWVTAIGSGFAQIKCMAADGSGIFAFCNVTVKFYSYTDILADTTLFDGRKFNGTTMVQAQNYLVSEFISVAPGDLFVYSGWNDSNYPTDARVVIYGSRDRDDVLGVLLLTGNISYVSLKSIEIPETINGSPLPATAHISCCGAKDTAVGWDYRLMLWKRIII